MSIYRKKPDVSVCAVFSSLEKWERAYAREKERVTKIYKKEMDNYISRKDKLIKEANEYAALEKRNMDKKKDYQDRLSKFNLWKELVISLVKSGESVAESKKRADEAVQLIVDNIPKLPKIERWTKPYPKDYRTVSRPRDIAGRMFKWEIDHPRPKGEYV